MDIFVISSGLIAGEDGSARIECQFSDYSIWSCDAEGKDWKRHKPSDLELTKFFKERT